MSKPEGGGFLPPVDPIQDSARHQAEQRINELVQIAERRGGNISLDTIVRQGLADSNKEPSPENIFLERYQIKTNYNGLLLDAKIEPGEDPLVTKIDQAFPPADAEEIITQTQSSLLSKVRDRLFNKTNPELQDPSEREWITRWEEYFDQNWDQVKKLDDYDKKNEYRLALASTIAAFKPSSISLYPVMISTREVPPSEPLLKRLESVIETKSGPEALENFRNTFFSNIHNEIMHLPSGTPPTGWLFQWEFNPEFQEWLNKKQIAERRDPYLTSGPVNLARTPDTEGSPSLENGDSTRSVTKVAETLEDARAAEATVVEENRQRAITHLEALFVAKTETFPGLPDEKYTDLSLFSVLAKMDRDSFPAGSPYEKLLKNYNQEITEIVNLLVEAKIRPEAQNSNDELYENLNLILSPQDKAQVMQRAMYRIYHTIFSESHDPSDPNAEWINSWRDFFTSDEKLVKQLKWQNTKLDGQTVMGIEISELRAGEHKSNEAIVNNLLRCYINPDQFDNHPFVRQLSDILGPGWSTVRLQYFQKFTHMRSSDLRRVDSYDMVINPYSRPESLSSAFYDSWINDPRVVELRAQQATGHQPETTPAVVTPEAPKTKWSQKITGLIVKSSKAIYEKVKRLNVKDAFLGKGGDVVMAGMIGAAVRGLASSDPSWGPTIALLSGGAFGAYHGFNREVNNRYQTTIAKKASTGDADATTELDNLSKENILQKEKFLKKECWKRYKALPGKDKAAVVSYTLVGAFVGATVAEIGYLGMEDMYMHQDKSVIEDFFSNSFYDIFNVPRPAGPGEFRGGLK